MGDFLLLAWLLVAGAASALIVRNRTAIGIAVAFSSIAALVERTRFLDGASSGCLAAGMAWIIGAWIAMNQHKTVPRSFSALRQVAIFISVVVWLYASLEWHESSQVRSLAATSHAHLDSVLSAAAVATGLTTVLVGIGSLFGIGLNRHQVMLLGAPATTLAFSGTFAVNALYLMEFFGRQGDSMAWAVPVIDHLCSWFFLYFILVFTLFVLYEVDELVARVDHVES